jgi:hypothetical protein
MELAHVITAMLSGKPARVICKTCKSEHKYRSGPGKSPGINPRAPRPTRQMVLCSEYWSKKMQEKKSRPLVPYSPKTVFGVGDRLSHPRFGDGCVEEVKRAGKVVVIFKDGERVLIHAQESVSIEQN